MDRRDFLYTLAAGLPALTALDALALPRGNNSKIVYPGKNGKLVYIPDEKGNIIPDFSNCGYGGGGIALPDVPVKEALSPAEGDSSVRIQAAIDRVSKMPADRNGFRGAVLLKRGTYRLSDSIHINESGIVLRGEGDSEKGTVLIAAKREKSHKLIEIRGKSAAKAVGPPIRIVDEYVPVGTRSFRVDSTGGLRPGDKIVVRRIGNKDWISHLKMDQLPPRQGANTIQWSPLESDYERIITNIERDRITIDAPIVCAIERRWGGGRVYALDDSERIRNIGVEHIRGVSEFDPRVTEVYGKEKKVSHSDEEHAWDFIYINFAENVWIRNITALRFAYSAVNIGKAKWVTV